MENWGEVAFRITQKVLRKTAVSKELHAHWQGDGYEVQGDGTQCRPFRGNRHSTTITPRIMRQCPGKVQIKG